jgi:hypothetical protein
MLHLSRIIAQNGKIGCALGGTGDTTLPWHLVGISGRGLGGFRSGLATPGVLAEVVGLDGLGQFGIGM